MPITTNFDTFVERAGGYCPWLNDIDEEDHLPEDHTLDMFIDKLEELCLCKGEGYQTALEHICEFKNENKKLKKQNEELKKQNKKLEIQHTYGWNLMWKLKEQLDIANEYCEQWGYKWDEKEEVYVNEDDGLSDSEDE